MKILMIGPFSPPLSGVSIANDNLIEGLHKDHTVDKIDFSSSAIKEDIGKFSFSKVVASLRVYLKVFKIPRSDFIYMTPGQTFYGVLKYAPFILLSKLLGKKTIVHVHGNYVRSQYEKLTGIKKKVYKSLLSIFDKGIVLSPGLRGNLSPFLSADSIHVVFNFVEDNIRQSIHVEDIAKKNVSALNILFLSNLMKQKGILDLLESLTILKAKDIPFKAVIAGAIDEETKNDVNSYLDQLKGHVTYPGVIKGEEKVRTLLGSNVFVFPTYYEMEGQPIALLEAMSTGNIIITTEHAGIPDIFKPGINGFYAKKQNPDDLANELERIAINLGEYRDMMLSNHLETKKNFTLEKFVKGVENVIKGCKI